MTAGRDDLLLREMQDVKAETIRVRDGVHDLRDELNSHVLRTAKAEKDQERRTAELAHDIADHRKRLDRLETSKIAAAITTGAEPDRRSSSFFTKRESALIALGLGVLAAVLKLGLMAGSFAIEAVKMLAGKH